MPWLRTQAAPSAAAWLWLSIWILWGKHSLKSYADRCSLGLSPVPVQRKMRVLPCILSLKGSQHLSPRFQQHTTEHKFQGLVMHRVPAAPVRGAASTSGGKSRPSGSISAPHISVQRLLHYPHASRGAGVNIKQVWYSFLIKLSG